MTDEFEIDAETQAAIDDWFPYWQRPRTVMEWEKLLRQAKSFAVMTDCTYRGAVRSNMPLWFIQKVAKSRYRKLKRYKRLKVRVQDLKMQLAQNLLAELGCCPSLAVQKPT